MNKETKFAKIFQSVIGLSLAPCVSKSKRAAPVINIINVTLSRRGGRISKLVPTVDFKPQPHYLVHLWNEPDSVVVS